VGGSAGGGYVMRFESLRGLLGKLWGAINIKLESLFFLQLGEDKRRIALRQEDQLGDCCFTLKEKT
jgi:hypothetical protein